VVLEVIATRSLSVDSIWIASESVGFSVGALHCRALQAAQASMSFVWLAMPCTALQPYSADFKSAASANFAIPAIRL
jgi:hypothetical protein